MLKRIPINPTSDETFAIDIGQGLSGVNMTTVTAVSLKVNKPSQTDELTWTANIVSSSATSLRVRHQFAAGEVDRVGTYRIHPILTVAGSQKRSTPVYFEGTFN